MSYPAPVTPVRALRCALLFFVTLTAAAFAAEPTRQYDLPTSTAETALKQFSEQSGAGVVFFSDAVKGIPTNAVKGQLTARDALTQLLAGTPLVITEDPKTGAFAVRNPTPTEPKNAPRALVLTSDRPSKTHADETAPGEKVTQLDTFEVFARKTLNMDVVRTKNDPQAYYIFEAQELAQSGATSVEEFLKQRLTMNTTFQSNSQKQSGSTASSGATSSVNLRGLGANQTLILIDGRRTSSVNLSGFNSTGAMNQPDINGIPLSAIERIEVLPSSASAIYGGAAVGGVVNIVTKRNFSGGDVSIAYERPEDSNAYRRKVDLCFGTSFNGGRTQILVAGGYADEVPLLVGDRKDIIKGAIDQIGKNSPAFLYNPVSPWLGGATTNVRSLTTANLVLKNGTLLGSRITSVPAGAAPGADITNGLVSAAGTYNTNLSTGTGVRALQTALGVVPTTKSFRTTVRQTIFKEVQLFAEFSRTQNLTHAAINPIFGQVTVPNAAPTNPFQGNVGVVFPSAFTTASDSSSKTEMASLGLLVPLTRDWKAELDYTWSHGNFESKLGLTDGTGLSAAISNGSVNPFVDTLVYQQNLAPYVGAQTYSGASTLDDVNFRIGGSGFRLPGGDQSIAIGIGHRKEGAKTATLEQLFPSTANNLGRSYFGQPQTTDSIYVETKVPIIAPLDTLPGVYSLSLLIAGRSEKYYLQTGTLFQTLFPATTAAFDPPQGVKQTVNYTSTNPTIAIKYNPVSALAFRASYSTAFLPPAPGQFLVDRRPAFGFPAFPITDPASGLSYSVDISQGGNPDLRPQTSKNWNFGLIWEPLNDAALHGLRVSVEYYQIEQPNFITTPTAQQVVGDASLANRITRDPVTGLITLVDTSPLNATKYRTNGWDMALDYHTSTRGGVIDLHAAATYVSHDKRQFALGSASLEYVGFPGDGGEVRLKGNASVNWSFHAWNFAWASVFYSGYRQINSPGSPSYITAGGFVSATNNTPQMQGGNTIPSQNYHQLYVRYDFHARSTEGKQSPEGMVLSNLSLEFGINNVLNTTPPFDAGAAPYYRSYYGDLRLRSYHLAVKKAF